MGIKVMENKSSEKCPSTLDMKPVERTLQIIVAFLHDNKKNLEAEEEDSMKNKSNLLLYYFVSEPCDKNDALQNLCIETFGKRRDILKCESEMFSK
ncbi:hypothetical protein CEXT_569861 [Caerostris extrusa]|uniref:Uncharacterized protein n=1 Tax=Caerostris extrusa TaxID=172846 RepID=A0AAV4VVQ2_CAEEX|nr:hypothetical protein CEXT_569861 [Caerostris extrusa]